MDDFAQSLAIGRTQRHLVNRMRQTLAPSSLRGLNPATIEGKCHGLFLRALKKSHHHGQARNLRPYWRHVKISSLRMDGCPEQAKISLPVCVVCTSWYNLAVFIAAREAEAELEGGTRAPAEVVSRRLVLVIPAGRPSR